MERLLEHDSMTSRALWKLCIALALSMLGCKPTGLCPAGATLTRLPDPVLDGGTAALCRTAQGQADGPVTLTYDGTRPRLEGRFEKNRPVGPWTWWYPDGKKRASYAYAQAGLEGAFETWHPNGKAHWRVTFQNGVPQGPVRELRDDGTKRYEGLFVTGRRGGTWTAWYRTGVKAAEGHYQDDKPTGRWTAWGKNGAVTRTREAPGEWTEAVTDAGARAGEDSAAALLSPTAVWGEEFSTMTVSDALGPPEYVPPLSEPDLTGKSSFYPWDELHDVWFAEFRIELKLQPEDLE
jgi:antitoxin component YwqK of YwqJK toxin-antitoxin module